jgi:K(+)-stimulated pyrophosphate-energized sodium pump
LNKCGDSIHDGAKSFFTSQYKYLALVIFIVFGTLLAAYSIESPTSDVTDGLRIGGCFLMGALLSLLSSYIGVAISTDSNIRTAHAAATDGISKALKVAFTACTVLLPLGMLYWGFPSCFLFRL